MVAERACVLMGGVFCPGAARTIFNLPKVRTEFNTTFPGVVEWGWIDFWEFGGGPSLRDDVWP